MKIKIEVKEINCDVIIKENFWHFLYSIGTLGDIRVNWKYKNKGNTLKIVDMCTMFGDDEILELVFKNQTARDLVMCSAYPDKIVREVIEDIYRRLKILVGGGVND